MATDVEEGMFLDYQTRPLSQEARPAGTPAPPNFGGPSTYGRTV